MICDVKENNDRLFIINFFLNDDTISVYELSSRNAGFKGGEFIGRCKMYFPNQNIYTSHRPAAYSCQDLYLGAIVNFRNFIFQIVSADLRALTFMEDHKEIVSVTKFEIILIFLILTYCLVSKKSSTFDSHQSKIEINSNLQGLYCFKHD